MKKNNKNKGLILEQLRKTPITETACQKIGISRMTLYRWKKEDPEFAVKFDEALIEGRHLVTDVAVSQLLSAIKNGNMTAITFWLKHFDENFKTKIEVSGTINQVREELTEEEAALLAEALRLSGFSSAQTNDAEKIINLLIRRQLYEFRKHGFSDQCH